jgi:hypothetical protein
MGLLLQDTLGVTAADFRLHQIFDRVFHFVVT